MFPLNASVAEISTFLWIGIPGFEHERICSSIPICLIYLLAALGNCTILFVLWTEHSLHEPAFYFLSMLALSDLSLSFTSLPTMLRIFLFNAMGISVDACFTQEFFIHGFTDMESSVLLIMSFDRFVAIHYPLRYSSILTSARVLQTGLGFATKSILLVLPLPFILKKLKNCNRHLLSHSYYLHQDIMELACSDNRDNFYYGLFVRQCVLHDVSVFIAVSYVFILKTVLSIASHGQCLKSLTTSVSHICAVLIFYVPTITLAIMHHFTKHKSLLAIILIADVFSLVPPLMNPIVCVRTQQFRAKVLEKLGLKSK